MKIWAVVAAAGVGLRMNSAVPKQYLPLQGIPVLAHTLQRLLELPLINSVAVALSAEELQSAASYWQQLAFNDNPRILICAGADSRQSSVSNALDVLAGQAHDDDWVLVHDAVRPCVRISDINLLINAVQHHPAGGLLAAPVRDTLKLAGADAAATPSVQAVHRTFDRRLVWAAFTPQMFRYGLLRKALQHAINNGLELTDESSAIEALGYKPLLIRGNPDNIKITHPEDLLLASAILTAQTNERKADV